MSTETPAASAAAAPASSGLGKMNNKMENVSLNDAVGSSKSNALASFDGNDNGAAADEWIEDDGAWDLQDEPIEETPVKDEPIKEKPVEEKAVEKQAPEDKPAKEEKIKDEQKALVNENHDTTTSNGHTAKTTENGHAKAPAPAPTPVSAPIPLPVSAPAPAPAPTAVTSSTSSDTTAKLDAMTKDREALRAEVELLRKQLETIQESHASEVTQLKSDLEESNAAKETAEEQYEALLERVEKIKETLSDRLKRDKAELEEAKERIEELEAENENLQAAQSTGEGHNQKMQSELEDAQRELNTLRSRNNLSAQNWTKEKEELTRTVQRLKEEVNETSNAMGEWEVLAMEERSIKENLSEKVADLEDQIESLRQGYEGASTERDSQATLIDNLQNALREIQDARKKELRDMVESTDAQLQAQKKLVSDAETRSSEAEAARDELAKEVERTAPFEKEVKEKNLHIGKLRHEAIILNDHLTKALRYLKKTKPEENVDRQVVTNHLLHFLTLDRADAKRFQVLQVMAGYLNWTDEQREQAGLSRPGGSVGSLRLPGSPFRRTPSSPALSADVFTEPTPKDKESLSELWAGFLERSASEGQPGEGGSTKGSSKPVSPISETPPPQPSA